jgi:hypothetical protein
VGVEPRGKEVCLQSSGQGSAACCSFPPSLLVSLWTHL